MLEPQPSAMGHGRDTSRNDLLWGQGMGNACFGADNGAITDGNGTQGHRSGTDDDIVAHGGMPFLLSQSCAAEDYSLVQENIITNLRGLADDYAGTVVDKESPADFCPGMDFDIGQEAIKVSEPSGRKPELVPPQIMSYAM